MHLARRAQEQGAAAVARRGAAAGSNGGGAGGPDRTSVCAQGVQTFPRDRLLWATSSECPRDFTLVITLYLANTRGAANEDGDLVPPGEHDLETPLRISVVEHISGGQEQVGRRGRIGDVPAAGREACINAILQAAGRAAAGAAHAPCRSVERKQPRSKQQQHPAAQGIFQLYWDERLDKLALAVSQDFDLDADAVRLAFDGHLVPPDATPASLGLEEGDALELLWVEVRAARRHLRICCTVHLSWHVPPVVVCCRTRPPA